MKVKLSFIFVLWKNYIVFIIFPGIVIMSTTFYMSDMLKTKTIEHNVSIINQVTISINREFENLNRIAIQIISNPRLKRMGKVNKNIKDKDYFELWKVKNIFEEYINIFSMGDFCLYFNKSDIIISSNSLCTDFKRSYGKRFNFDNLSYNEFKTVINDLSQNSNFIPYNNITIGNDKLNGIIYHYKINISSSPNESIFLFLVLDYDYINSIISPLFKNHTYVFILNNQNDTIYKGGGGY